MKVVIIKLGALGDIIMSTPVIKSLLAEHKNDELFLLTSPAYAELFEGWQGLSLKQFPRKGLGTSLKTALWLRTQGFDRVYDLQSNDRSRVLCCLSGIKEKVGNHNHFPYTHSPGDSYTGQSHIFDRHKQLLKSIGIEAVEEKPFLPVSVQARERVKLWLKEHSLNSNKLVLMHAGASLLHPQKRWPHFSALAQKLVAAGYAVVWLGAGDDADLNARLAVETGIDASNAFSIVELIALGQEAQYAITNDSGPMHVLACAGLPVYALFGPTDWRRHHAIGQRNCVISLDKSNSVWNADDYFEADTRDLALISAEMLWSLLLKENQIRP
jgi:ADP-heptose:LPS heptosyltransferase